jgi:hypothetical protein
VGLTADVVSSVALCMRCIRKNGSSRGVMRVIAVPMTMLRCVHQRPRFGDVHIVQPRRRCRW